MKPKVTDHTDIVRRTIAGITREPLETGGVRLHGHCATPWGFVIVNSHPKPNPGTTLIFIWAGKEYYRYIQAQLMEEALVKHAHNFAKEISSRHLSLFD